MPSTDTTPAKSPREEWAAFARRANKRLITAFDYATIMISDAVILGLGFGAFWLLDKLPADALSEEARRFFETARFISSVLFMILYVVVVGFHIYEFFTSELESS